MDIPLPPHTRYDQIARYLLTRTQTNFFTWVSGLTAEQIRFDRWLSPQLTLPGVKQRLCDGVARLVDLTDGGRPYAALMEIQTTPAHSMPGRVMLAGGLVLLTVKPSDLPGDRYELVAIVLNLTGRGSASYRSVMGVGEWKLKPIEINFEELDAGVVLEHITTEAAPWELLAFIPLMQRGGEPGIIQHWKELALARDDQERGDCALARVFAERVGRNDVWEDVMNEVTFIESPMIGRMLSEAEARGEAKGSIKEKSATLVRMLRRRPWGLPEDLLAIIEACTSADQLDLWIDAAQDAGSLEQFRQLSGL